MIDSSIFHVPLIVSFPAILPKNTTNDTVIEVADIVPTIFELLVQEPFASASAKGMVNTLYGASGRTYARALGSSEDSRVPAIFIDSNTPLWSDKEGEVFPKNEEQNLSSFTTELFTFSQKIKNTSQ